MKTSQPGTGAYLCLCDEPTEAKGPFDALLLSSPHPVTVYGRTYRHALEAYVLMTVNDDDHRRAIDEDDELLLRLFDCLPQHKIDLAWHVEILEMILREKARQHKDFADALAATRGFTIRLRSYNRYWGSGDREDDQGTGSQLYPELLEAIRHRRPFLWTELVAA